MTKALYDEFAAQYLDLLDRDKLNFQSNLLPRILEEILARNSPSRALDIGCGPGTFSQLLNESCGGYVGIDESTKMIELAKRRHFDIQHCFLASSLEDFSNVGFDFVLASFVHHYFPSIHNFFGLVSKNVLRKGTLVVATIHPLKVAARVAKQTKRPIGATYLSGSTYRTDFLSRKNRIAVYSHSISTTINTAFRHGFITRQIFEPPHKDKVDPSTQRPSLLCFEFERRH